jgi:hypothetical protein
MPTIPHLERQTEARPVSTFWVTFWTLTTGGLAIVVLLVALALVTRLKDETSGAVLAVFPPRTPQDQIFAAIEQSDARVLRATRLANAWILEGTQTGFVGALKSAGALGAWKPVSGVSFAVGGCGFGAVLSNDPLFSPQPASS